MSFAERYLQKHAVREKLINDKPADGLCAIITIPAYNETDLVHCLDSLYKLSPASCPAEVLVLINIHENAPADEKKRNRKIYEDALSWSVSHQRKDLRFHVLFENSLPEKEFGAGLARKIAMDEAIRRFDALNREAGIILSLDADAVVDPNYLNEVTGMFNEYDRMDGCTIDFEHPIEGDQFPDEVYNAIVNYELHLRYYLRAVRFSGYPYAFHTIGSCFSVKALCYCNEGGMSRRQAGEDFYFIQKVASNGRFRECRSTKVYPSPRPSDRVLFGTGPSVKRQIDEPGDLFMTYNPNLFVHLKKIFEIKDEMYHSKGTASVLNKVHPYLGAYLDETDFPNSLNVILKNTASIETFRKRFYKKFNMLWILKYLHSAESAGTRKVTIERAAKKMLSLTGIDINTTNKKELLKVYREYGIPIV
ncbi:MAG: hypothetical protein K9J30_01750 [Bacteroidales bacterium]|nr:hypothetical protein [Bacteroidales bacterium]